MRFVLEVAVDDAQPKETTVSELGRILRYWGGNLHHYALRPGDTSAVYDSEYREVGAWRITADAHADADADAPRGSGGPAADAGATEAEAEAARAAGGEG